MSRLFSKGALWDLTKEILLPAAAADGVLEVQQLPCGRTGECSCNDFDNSTGASLYVALPSNEHIRVVELLPGPASKPLECRLHLARLPDDQSSYEALSYTWQLDADKHGFGFLSAPKSETPTIVCNGQATPVSRNLLSALQRLRYEDRSRFIWADAICINQDDMAERSNQVQKMSLIFESASVVLIWLGDGVGTATGSGMAASVRPSRSSSAFAAVCDIINAWRDGSKLTSAIPRATFSGSRTGTEDSPPQDLLSATSVAWADVFKLYDSRWFTRLWVVQEAALSRRAVVVRGDCEISWEWIGLAAAIIRTNYDRIPAEVKGSASYLQGPRRKVPSGIAQAYFIYRLSRSQRYFKPLGFTFLELLQMTRHLGCQDQRDRVFGLLGLPTTDNGSCGIFADYTKPIGQIFLELARKILLQSGSLSLLSSVQINPGRLSFERTAQIGPLLRYGENYPSWIPRWCHLLTQTLAPHQRHASFDASGGRQPQYEETSDPAKLILRGVIVDQVVSRACSHFKSFRRGPSKAGGSLGQQERVAYSDINTIENCLKRHPPTKTRLEHIAMTLTAGKDWYGTPVEDILSHVADFSRCLLKDELLWALAKDAFWNDGDASEPEYGNIGIDNSDDHEEIIDYEGLQVLSQGGNADRFLDNVTAVCERRAGFVTSRGMIGVGPESTRKGDLLCVLYGADVPFIIQRQETGYALLGESYVRDIMRGEAVERPCDPENKLGETWIELV